MEGGPGTARSPGDPVAEGPDPALTADQVAPETRSEVMTARRAQQGPSDRILLPLVFIGSCLIIFLRSPPTVLHPELWAEDGTVWFEQAYNQGWLTPLFHPQVGYLQTLPRLVADIGLLLPLSWVPALFVAVAVVVQALPAFLVASRRYAGPVPDYRVRLLLGALYLVLPNSFEINANLTDAQWHLGILAVLVVLAAPTSGLWKVFDTVVILLSGLTGPFVVSIVIVAAIFYVCRRQRWTLVLGCIGIVAGLAQAIAYLSSPRTAAGPLGVTGGRLVEIIGGRVVANTVLGSASTTSKEFTSHLFAFSLAPLVVAVVIVGVAVWKGPLELKLFNLFGFLELAAALGSPLASLHAPQWPILAHTSGVRYWEFPSLAFMADVVWAVGQWRSRWRVLSVLSAIVLIALASFGVREDFRYRTFTAPSWAAQVRRFDALAPGRPFTFRIRPRWTMNLNKK